MLHCPDHGSRCHGRSGELVKLPAVTPNAPAAGFRIGQRPLRELLGNGTILGRLDLLGLSMNGNGIQLVDSGFLLMLLPPGAFFSLALLIAAKNMLDHRQENRNRRTGMSQENSFE